MPYKNRVRLPISFGKPQFPMERNIFRKADGSSKVLSIVIKNTFEGNTDQLPELWHRKLVVALSHDDVTIENERLLSDVVLSSDYSIDWQNFLNYPIATASFQVEVTPFNATNSNCQTCDEMTQLNLVDDTTAEIWDEGTTHEFPDILTDNDSICCIPFTIILVTYNTTYFTSVTIDANGVLTATVIDPAPDINDVWIATYRVTCPDGSYDEADVYGNISGSVVYCGGAINPEYLVISETEVDLSWTAPSPAPTSYDWTLYLTSDLGTPVQSGNVLVPAVSLTGLSAITPYTIVIISDCGGGNESSPVSLEFSIPSPGTCADFIISYAIAGPPLATCSYMDCNGDIITLNFTEPTIINKCMLTEPSAVVPFYFVASTPLITVGYSSLC